MQSLLQIINLGLQFGYFNSCKVGSFFSLGSINIISELE